MGSIQGSGRSLVTGSQVHRNDQTRPGCRYWAISGGLGKMCGGRRSGVLTWLDLEKTAEEFSWAENTSLLSKITF